MVSKCTHTLLVQLEAAKMTKKTEQDLVMKALAKKNDPDAVVTLSATVSETRRLMLRGR